MDTKVGTAVLRRWEIIDSLRHEKKDKRTLVENLDCSRSTVNRAIRELESMGLIEYNDGKHTVTPLGETIASGFEETMENVELRIDLDPFLQWIPEEEFDLNLSHLSDADLLLPEPGDPYSVINRHIKRLKTMEKGSFLLPFTGLHASETAYEQITQHGAEAEIIVAPDVVKAFKTNTEYGEAIEKMASTGRLEIFQATTEMPFSLGLINDRVQIIADEDEEPRALVETDSPAVRDWAETTIEEYKREADPVKISPETTKIRS